MAKVKLGQVVSGNFLMSLNKLSEQQVSALAAWSIAKIHKKASENVASYEEARTKAIKKYASLKEDGSVDSDEKGQVVFKSDEDKEAAIKDINELLNQEVTLPELKLSSLGDMKVDVGVIAALESVITEE
jgi:hypothetical protein